VFSLACCGFIFAWRRLTPPHAGTLNAYREAYYLPPHLWLGGISDDAGTRAALEALYAHAGDVELVVGAYAEQPSAPFARASFGATVFHMILLQAARYSLGDRFFFQHAGVLSAAQVRCFAACACFGGLHFLL
jgi:hypothetical protein